MPRRKQMKKEEKVPVKPRNAKERVEAIEGILQNFETKLAAGDVKVTLGDYIKLLQLTRDLGGKAPSRIVVTWVDPRSEE